MFFYIKFCLLNLIKKRHLIDVFLSILFIYIYEENIAEVNTLINSDLEIIYIRADNAAISSFMVSKLPYRKQDISKFVPDSIFKIL